MRIKITKIKRTGIDDSIVYMFGYDPDTGAVFKGNLEIATEFVDFLKVNSTGDVDIEFDLPEDEISYEAKYADELVNARYSCLKN